MEENVRLRDQAEKATRRRDAWKRRVDALEEEMERTKVLLHRHTGRNGYLEQRAHVLNAEVERHAKQCDVFQAELMGLRAQVVEGGVAARRQTEAELRFVLGRLGLSEFPQNMGDLCHLIGALKLAASRDKLREIYANLYAETTTPQSSDRYLAVNEWCAALEVKAKYLTPDEFAQAQHEAAGDSRNWGGR
jgi:hypothetical protein